MMARCGRPEQDSCPRVVGCGASARKRGRLVLAPPKCARNPPDQTQEEAEPTSQQPKAGTASSLDGVEAVPPEGRNSQTAATAESRNSQQPNSLDGVEAVPPEGRNSRRANSQTAPGSTSPATEQPTAAEPTAAEPTAAEPTAEQPGRRGSRPSRRQEQPNSRKPKQPTAAEPTAWTAWKPSLQKAGTAGTANSPGLNAPGYRTAESRNSQQPPSQQPGRRGSRPSRRQEQPEQPNSPGLNAPGYRTADSRRANSRRANSLDGVEAVPPEGRNSRKAAGPRFSVPVFWRDGLHPVRAVGCWLLILRLLAPGFFSGHGRRGSRPSKRQEQPQGYH